MSAILPLNSNEQQRQVTTRLHGSHSTPHWVNVLLKAVESTDFGTIQIKIHGGEVVQIETTHKIRIPSDSSSSTPFKPTAHTEAS